MQGYLSLAANLKLYLVAMGLFSALLGGCAIERQLTLDPAPSSSEHPRDMSSSDDLAPSVASAPTTPVSSSELPPPPGASDAMSPNATTELSLSPAANGRMPADHLGATSSAPQSTPSVGTPPPRIASGAQAAGLGGHWTLSVNGQACPLTLQEPPSSRTGWVQANASCGSFAEAASWTLSGNQLLLYDRNTRPLGKLTAAGPNRFEGNTAQGATISLVR